ncbi:MAG TPA: ABC transporter permease, partial [Reyranella sp.]|nr:ABC transporter permease [Reyranella sp.]
MAGGTSWLHRAADSDIWWSFKSSSLTVLAAAVTALIVLASFLAPVLAPHTPFDPSTLSLSDGLKPPGWLADGDWSFPLGTDDQGRDVLSSIMYGTRLSLVVGFASVIVSLVLGIALGLVSGYVGGVTDSIIMRIADVQLTFPAILVALLIDGIVRGIISSQRHDEIALFVIIGAIGLSFWVQYARTVRGSVMVEKNKEYVQAARVIGLSPVLIMVRHVLPNVTGPVLVIATINLGLAIISEATLSFLGVGLPSTQPS